jgi:putative aldouronate transport system permease protein
MLFRAGMIPKYLIVKNLGLIDTLWALILCQAMTPFNFLIMRANMENIPDSLEESVKLDGGGPLTILFKIVVPLSMPVVVALILFYGVAHWNRFFEAVLYINSRSKWTMSLILREIITEDPNAIGEAAQLSEGYVYPKTIQNATIIITIIPIMLIYPFIQRYFISGIMIGAVKG